MLTSRPAPGGIEPCYLAGCTYTLATEGEIAMAKAFIEEGAAVNEDEPAEAVEVNVEAELAPKAEKSKRGE
jgi:hypothetical protein